MKKIEAWQAKDGTQFSTEAQCSNYEKLREFESWHTEHRIRSREIQEPQTQHLHNWLTTNAEAIRGFLPPVAAKPDLNIKVLKNYMGRSSSPDVINIKTVERWLAGELK